MEINSCRELWAAWIGCAPLGFSDEMESEERSKALLKKWVFKGTECGCVFESDKDSVYVSGYAEGSDAELPGHSLMWGFTLEEFNAALTQADAEGVEAWEEANDSEDVEIAG